MLERFYMCDDTFFKVFIKTHKEKTNNKKEEKKKSTLPNTRAFKENLVHIGGGSSWFSVIGDSHQVMMWKSEWASVCACARMCVLTHMHTF